MQEEKSSEIPVSESESVPQDKPSKTEFKKPVLIGRVGKLPRKSDQPSAPASDEQIDSKQEQSPPNPEKSNESEKTTQSKENENRSMEHNKKSSLPPAVLLKELSTPIPYKEPKWSGLPPEGSNYKLEVLKSGVILEEVNLMEKPYHVFGRLANCDIVTAHPTISRHHAVLQYKALSDSEDRPPGYYLFDCGSTHGTFLNKNQLQAKTYVRVRVGHMIKLGCSTRSYILLGPDWDAEGESELSITEMKEKHAEMKLKIEREIREAAEKREMERREEEKRREEAGIDWGMGEDAEDEPDLAENPYASTANEQLYLDDPKKTLRGYFEREGHELSYDCEEKAPGQFMCRVELPIEDSRGRNVMAEAIHRGKKKEAVIACALEACRILDRHGLLRQAKHESRRRKERDWSADDFYDSDEDTFLERTGAVERKRTQRMQKHQANKEQAPLTYDTLVEKCEEIRSRISKETNRLEDLRKSSRSNSAKQDQDDLDSYMRSLDSQKQSLAQKADISKLKSEIAELKIELAKTERLAEIARPTDLPKLEPKAPAETSKLKMKLGTNSVIYGKRIKLKTDTKTKVTRDIVKKEDQEFVEEMDSDDETADTKSRISQDTSVDKTSNSDAKMDVNISEDTVIKQENHPSNEDNVKSKRVFGPMRPPADYVMPTSYLEAETDRDDQNVMEED